jgi:hypothetical protein
MGTHVTASMKRRMRHSVAANLRERGEINTLLVATEHRMPARAMTKARACASFLFF